PLFASHSVQELLLVSLVFLLLTGLWAWLGQKIARWPRLQAMILGRQRVVTAWLYFSLSAYIVLKKYN
ncbi:MAG: cadmium resistance transporter, partial [Lactobacillus porci]|nr:cadmium resistance transporter [Lactobacillus porci]